MEFLSLSRRRSSEWNVPSDEERGETDVFAGYQSVFARGVLSSPLTCGLIFGRISQTCDVTLASKLKYVIHLHTSIAYIRLVWFLVRDFVPLFRSFLDWFQSTQTRRCHCLRLKDVLMFQASSYSAGKRTFQWMLVNNILWMAPDHQAVYLGDNYTLSLSLLNTCTV